MAAQFREQRPDMHTSLIAWEQSWEEDFEKHYGPGGTLTGLSTLAGHVSPETVAWCDTPQSFTEIELRTRGVCELQEKLFAEAQVDDPGKGRVETYWPTLPDALRKAYILEGISRTLDLNEEFVEGRKWCPESSLKYLASDNGNTYLNVLRQLIPTTLTTPHVVPRHVPHRVFDRLTTLPPAYAAKQ